MANEKKSYFFNMRKAHVLTTLPRTSITIVIYEKFMEEIEGYHCFENWGQSWVLRAHSHASASQRRCWAMRMRCSLREIVCVVSTQLKLNRCLSGPRCSTPFTRKAVLFLKLQNVLHACLFLRNRRRRIWSSIFEVESVGLQLADLLSNRTK